MSNLLSTLEDSIKENGAISSLLQETLNELNFKPHGKKTFYYSDEQRADMYTKAIAMIRDYAKRNGN